MHTTDRTAAARLAQRIERSMVDPTEIDEADRAPGDRSPGYANALISDAPSSVESTADLTHGDWAIIHRALEHYAGCNSVDTITEG
jgi:hypothetical protein